MSRPLRARMPMGEQVTLGSRIAVTMMALGLVLLLAGCGGEPPAPEPVADAPPSPRLLLFVVIDQGGMNDLLRYRPLYKGGLARLLDEGAVFTDAHHDHAETVTAAGHATLATGLHPSRSGIIGNGWYDRDTRTEVYCVGDPNHERSPANLLAGTLSDWVKDARPRAKVYSASGKDRSAVLMGGRRADGAYWYDRRTGEFTSSTYYPRGRPDWLDAFNARGLADAWFGKPWEPLAVTGQDLGGLGVVDTDTGAFPDRLPHAIGVMSPVPGPRFYADLYSTPFQDRLLVDLALTLIDTENLGGDDHLDVLSLGFSALDAVGHTWGPNSREFLDTLLRLDLWLGELLEHLDDRVGRERVVVMLSADHGVQPLPEASLPGEAGRRLDHQDVACFQQVGRRLQEALGDGEWLLEFPYLNYELIAERNLTRAAVESALVTALDDCEAVERVWTRTELEAPAAAGVAVHHLYAHSFHPERSGDVFVQLREGYLAMPGRSGTTHGSPYRYDTHVPVIFAGPGIAAGWIDERILTVDVAPTLATKLGIPTPTDLDGVDRGDLLAAE